MIRIKPARVQKKGIHDFTDEQKCEDTKSADGLKVSKKTGLDILSYTKKYRHGGFKDVNGGIMEA